MRPTILIFALSATAFGQTPPALDIVLLVEDSIPVTNLVSRTDLRGLASRDRVAVMMFSSKQSLKLALEGDYGKEFRASHQLDSKGTRSTTRLWDAVVKATELFDGPRDPSRRRVLFLVFSAEDKSSGQTIDTVRAALEEPADAGDPTAALWHVAGVQQPESQPERTPDRPLRIVGPLVDVERASPGLIARGVKPRQVGGCGEHLQLLARQRCALICLRKRRVSPRP